MTVRVARWVYEDFSRRWVSGKRTIYALESGSFVASEHGTWIPGSFDTLAAARAAFKVSNARLQALQDRANARAGGVGGTITLEDLGVSTLTVP